MLDLESFEVAYNLYGVLAWVNPNIFFNDLPGRVNNKGITLDSHKFSTHELFRFPAIICRGHCVIRVAEQRKVQVVLVSELLVAGDGIFADSDDLGIAYIGDGVAFVTELTGFGSAAWRVVLRIKIDNQPGAGVVGKRLGDAILILKAKIWGLFHIILV